MPTKPEHNRSVVGVRLDAVTLKKLSAIQHFTGQSRYAAAKSVLHEGIDRRLRQILNIDDDHNHIKNDAPPHYNNEMAK